MITRHTTKNSVYEVDEERGLVRRASGKNPAPVSGEVSDWQPGTARTHRLRPDLPVLIVEWRDGRSLVSSAISSSEVIA